MSITSLPLELLAWVGAIVIGLPILILLLGELIDRLEQQNSPLLSSVQTMRHVALPLFAIVILVQRVIEYDGSTSLVRMLDTIAWLTLIYIFFLFLGGVAEIAATEPNSWVAELPTLLFTVSRILIAGLIITHIVSNIWQIDVTSIFAALGVGALAISFALQSTVGSLVSGLLLMADRPFRPGDWISYDGSFYLVEEISWRSTTIRARDNSMLIIPNGVLSEGSIHNYGRSGTPYRMDMSIDYSDDYPPNYIMGILAELLENLDRIKDEPALPYVRVNSYGDSVIIYDMIFWIDFDDYFAVQTELNSKLFYIAKRNSLPRPAPVRVINLHQEGSSEEQVKEIVPVGMLKQISLFNSLNEAAFADLANSSGLYHYGRGEQIIEQGDIDENLYIIQEGRLSLLVVNTAAPLPPSIELSRGDVFGGMSLLYDEESSVSALVLEDLKVIQLPHQVLSRLLITQPRFANALNRYVNRRQQRLLNLANVEYAVDRTPVQSIEPESMGGRR